MLSICTCDFHGVTGGKAAKATLVDAPYLSDDPHDVMLDRQVFGTRVLRVALLRVVRTGAVPRSGVAAG